MAEAQVVSLAERLRERRTALGISQSQAARELDVARTAYRLWEMEAARPAPDRWRMIARWLGISVSTLLMAEELMSQEEAGSRGALAANIDGDVARPGLEERGDFFADARGLLVSGVAAGEVPDGAAEEMHAILDRIEDGRTQPETISWEPTEMVRDIQADDRAAMTARAGVRFVAAGVPETILDEAERLVGELVERSVAGADDAERASVGVSIVVGRERLRVEVMDPFATLASAGDPPRAEIPILHGAASRWGGTTEQGRRVTWFEMDLPGPGDVMPTGDGS